MITYTNEKYRGWINTKIAQLLHIAIIFTVGTEVRPASISRPNSITRPASPVTDLFAYLTLTCGTGYGGQLLNTARLDNMDRIFLTKSNSGPVESDHVYFKQVKWTWVIRYLCNSLGLNKHLATDGHEATPRRLPVCLQGIMNEQQEHTNHRINRLLLTY